MLTMQPRSTKPQMILLYIFFENYFEFELGKNTKFVQIGCKFYHFFLTTKKQNQILINELTFHSPQLELYIQRS